MQVTSFPWRADSRSERIILGSMPGVESLRLQQYYAHPRNQFWRLVYALHDGQPHAGYEERIRFMLDKRIALWDVVSHCERSGSLDSDIQNPVINDFSRLLTELPAIQALYFNGGKAYELFVRHAAPFLQSYNLALYQLPSSSPAYTLSYENKLLLWGSKLGVK